MAGLDGSGTSATPTPPNIDFNHSWPSPTGETERSFHVNRPPRNDAEKVTTITIDDTDESQKIAACGVKRLSIEELENMVQSQLGKVIDGHCYNAWLRKQVDDTDNQLAKYQKRIDVLQKHVNDLSVVIHKHSKGSEGMSSPPMKLTRNVGLQVRVKQDRKPVCEVTQLPNKTCSEKELSTSKDASVLSPDKQETPASALTSRKDQHYTAKSNEMFGRVESHLTSSLPEEIHLGQLSYKAANKPPINPSTSSSLSIAEVAMLLPTRTLPSQTRVPPALIPSASCATLPSFTVTQVQDLTTNREIPWTTSDYVRLVAPQVPKGKPENPIGFVLAERRPSLEQSVQSAGPEPLAGTPTHLEREPVRTAIVSSSSHAVPALSSASSFKTHSLAASSAQNAPARQKSSCNDLCSHPDRKRRLPHGIRSFDASTTASIEKYHKLMKDHRYNPKMHHTGLNGKHPSPVLHGNRMMQQPNRILDSKAIAPSIIAQEANQIPTQLNRKPTSKRMQQQIFEKRVKSIGIYRTWKLSGATDPVQSSPSVQNLPLLKPQTQQFKNGPKWSPPNPCLVDSIALQEDHQARKKSLPDMHGTIRQLPGPSRMHPELRKRGSLLLPVLAHDGYPAPPQLKRPYRGMRNLPDLIAISHEKEVSRFPTLPGSIIRDAFYVTLIKPILKLQRVQQGIQVEWNIPTLPQDQLDQVESYVLCTRKGNQILTADTPWSRAAVIPALPLPMCFRLKELMAGYWHHFRIGAVLRCRQSGAIIDDVPWSDAVSINV